MNLLITNDDGIEAEGIRILAQRLEKEHEVYVVAPDSNRSAVSNHLTIYNSLKLTRISERWWGCSGTPADCTFVGLRSDLFNVKFDAVISGINKGGNLGTDIVYSGTCGAARQAVLDGIPGIALSVDPYEWTKEYFDNMNYAPLADFAAENLEKLIKLSQTTDPRIFVNVNAPSPASYKGIKCCNSLCIREYGDKMKIINENGDTQAVFIPGGAVPKHDEECDAYAVKQGYVAVSRVYAEPLAAEIVDGMQFK